MRRMQQGDPLHRMIAVTNERIEVVLLVIPFGAMICIRADMKVIRGI